MLVPVLNDPNSPITLVFVANDNSSLARMLLRFAILSSPLTICGMKLGWEH